MLLEYICGEMIELDSQKEKEYQALLSEYEHLPKWDMRPTFMDICRYPGNRFEEVCSRVLQFYFNPLAEHGMSDLWLSALWATSGQAGELSYNKDVRCVTEEYAEGKRIDIIIESEDFIIAIENKTTAELYNPLDFYARHIKERYPNKKHSVLLILSVFPLKASESKIRENGFRSILYKGLFAEVNKRLGNYVMACDQKYLTHMLDFMKTIENMNNVNTQRAFQFFMKRKKDIDTFIDAYKRFNNEVLDEQKEQISKLLEKINAETGASWWVWQGWDLGISFNDESHRIGIESSYELTENGSCGKFHIYITTWSAEAWLPYESKVLENFPQKIHLDNTANNGKRVYLHLPVIEGNDTEKIIRTLADTYDKMQSIANEVRETFSTL